MPAMLTRPRVGYTPTSALVAAGMRIELPVSVPLPSTAMFAATAVTMPPDDPPGREAHVVRVAGASEGSAAVRVAVGEVGHVGVPDDDGAGGLEFRDDRRVLRRDQFVARARESLPAGGRDLTLDAGVRLDDDRHAPERPTRAAAPAAASALLTRRHGQRLVAEHGLDRAVDAVVAIDAVEVPLHDLRDRVVPLRRRGGGAAAP